MRTDYKGNSVVSTEGENKASLIQVLGIRQRKEKGKKSVWAQVVESTAEEKIETSKTGNHNK